MLWLQNPMSTALPPTSSLLQDAVKGRALLMPWTVEQYHWAIKTGYLEEDTAYELLDGWIVRKDRSAAGGNPMTIGDRDRMSVIRIADLVSEFKQYGCFLQSQQPVALPPLRTPRVLKAGDTLDLPTATAAVVSIPVERLLP